MVLSFLQIYSSDNDDESYKGSREDLTSEREWREKLAEEFQYEYHSTWGKYEQGEFTSLLKLLLSNPYITQTFEPSHEKTNNVVSDQVRHKSGCTVKEAG